MRRSCSSPHGSLYTLSLNKVDTSPPPPPPQLRSKNLLRPYNVTEGEEHIEESDSTYDLYHLNNNKSEPIQASVLLNQAETVMELDTGSSMSTISEATYRVCGKRMLPPFTPKPHENYWQKIAVVGEVPITAQYGEQTKELTLLVVQGHSPSLLGFDWLHQLKLN